MQQPRIAGPNLDGADPVHGVRVRGENEVPIQIGSRSGKREGFRRFENQIRRAKLPTLSKARRTRSVGGNAFGRSRRGPGGECANLFIGKAKLVLKIAVAWLREPGRHETPRGYIGDLASTLLDVFVAE